MEVMVTFREYYRSSSYIQENGVYFIWCTFLYFQVSNNPLDLKRHANPAHLIPTKRQFLYQEDTE